MGGCKQQEHLHFQSRLDSEYDRVIDLLFHKDKNTNKANDCVILVSSTKTPFFNPNYNLIFDYFKKLEYFYILDKNKDGKLQI